jgi:hypothetical protein
MIPFESAHFSHSRASDEAAMTFTLRSTSRYCVQLGAALAALLAASPASAAAPLGGKLAFAVRTWYTAVYETRFMDECPGGLNISNDEYWWRGLSKEERAKRTDNGLLTTLNRFGLATHRGPDSQDVCLNPDLVKDPPFITVEGKTSFGRNLDGTTDGRATPKSCAHEKFTGVNGEPAVDNQMYRLLGCTYGWRTNGIFEVNADEMRGTSGLGMILIEITGVDDPRNDDDVTVTFYRSVDQYAQGPNGRPLPFQTYRIDPSKVDGKLRYGDSLKGKIKDGKLTTASGDVRLPFYGNYNFMHPVVKDMSVELAIAPDGRTAKGMVYGYYDLEEFVYHVVGSGAVISTAGFSCPAFAEAARRLADGYPDPQTGKCTALSSAFRFDAYAAFVLKPGEETKTSAR